MKPRLLILLFVACALVAAMIAFRGRSAPQPLPTARFLCLPNGFPWKTTVTGLGSVASFARASTRNAVLIRDWLNAGTNAAVFSVSNSLDRAIDPLPQARLATPKDKGGWGQHTPLLLRTGEAGVYLRPGQAATVQVALLSRESPWRIQFCYLLVPTDQGLLKTVIAKLNGTATHGPTDFIYGDWITP